MDSVMNLLTGTPPVDRGEGEDAGQADGNVMAYMMVMSPMFMSLGVVSGIVAIIYQILDYIREKVSARLWC
jgi:hypothetical protein